MTRGVPFYLGPPSTYELNMRLMDDTAPAALPVVEGGIGDILPANMDVLPSAPLAAPAEEPLDPSGPYTPGEDLSNYRAIQDAASHAVIDGPASAQCSC